LGSPQKPLIPKVVVAIAAVATILTPKIKIIGDDSGFQDEWKA